MRTTDAARYRLYGRVCESTIALPELLTAHDTEDCQITVRVEQPVVAAPERWSHTIAAADGREWLAVASRGGDLWFRFLESTVWRCRRDCKTWDVATFGAPDMPRATVRHLLIDELIPALLANSGAGVLHGAAIAFEAGALVILGASGMGKSTLAASFALAGHALFSDDCVVLDPTAHGPVVQPSYPSVRIGRATAEYLLGDRSRGFAFAHYTNKRRYRDGLPFAKAPMPLAGIVTLDYGASECIEMQQLHGHSAAATILGSAKSLPIGSSKAATVEMLLDVANQVPVARIVLPDDLGSLATARDTLTQWVDSL
jgi:hypothetical protein